VSRQIIFFSHFISIFPSFVSFSYFRHFCNTIMHFFIPHFLFNLLFSVLTSTVSLLSFKQSPSEILSLSFTFYIFLHHYFYPCNLPFSFCSIYYNSLSSFLLVLSFSLSMQPI
jgi:hypothetical protein